MSNASKLPYATDRLPGIGGSLKREPEHFEVVEVPLYAARGTGPHVYVTLTRERRTTPEVAHDLARLFAVADRDVGYAGMKDKLARTTQTFSLPLDTAEPRAVAERIESELELEVHSAARHANKLRRGHLLGNRFRILVTELAAQSPERARAIGGALAGVGVPNYFGAQRGGDRGRNAARGRELLRDPAARRSWASGLLVSAYQSSLFNEWLAERILRGTFSRLLEGDVAKRRVDGALFDVLDAQAEQARFDAHEIVYTGPIFGARTRLAQGEPGAIERALVARTELDEADFARAGAKGSRRAGLLWIDDLTIETVSEGLSFAFTLPKGSYATVLLREFMKPSDDLALAPASDDE